MSTPESLNFDSGQDSAIGALIAVTWILNCIVHLHLVCDAFYHVLFSVLFKIQICHLQKPLNVDIDNIDTVLSKILLNTLHELRYHAPLRNILSLKVNVVVLIDIEAAIIHYKLRICCHILRLQCGFLLLLKVVGLCLSHTSFLKFERLECLRQQAVTLVPCGHQSLHIILLVLSLVSNLA